MLDVIEFVDRDYRTVRKDARLSSTQLRTRPSSFGWISKRYRNWRISRVEKKLERKKQNLLKEEFQANSDGTLTKSAMNKLMRKANAISRLEEKIKVLSRENVPSSFRASHAIKLRDKMFANLELNGNSAYVAGEEKYDKVFTDVPVVDEIPIVNNVPSDIVEPMAAAVDTSAENVQPEQEDSTISPADIKSAINEAFAQVRQNNVVTPITPEDVARTVEPYVERVADHETVQQEEEIATSVVEPEPVIPVIPTGNVGDKDDDIQREIDSVFGNAEDSLGETKFTLNSDAVARVNHFDGEGNSVKAEEPVEVEQPVETVQEPIEEPKTYQNLTDEEIARAQADLASHRILSTIPEEEVQPERKDFSVEPVVHSTKDENIRDFVVVTPDREILPKEETLEEQETKVEPESDVHFDYTDATVKDVAQAVEVETSIDGFESLRRRVAELQEKQRETKKAMEDAQRMAQNAAERAEQAKREAEERAAAREARIARLREYEEALVDDCAFNESKRRAAIENLQCDERFIEDQAARARQSDQVIEEIDALMGPSEAVNVRLK